MKKEKVLEVTMQITKNSFTDDKEELVEYLVCGAEINGQKIKFVPKAEDKSLFNYLMLNS